MSPSAQTPPTSSPVGILLHQDIIALCGIVDGAAQSQGTDGPIRPCVLKNVRSASYDLRLGTEFYMRPVRPPISVLAPSTWWAASRQDAIRATQRLGVGEALQIPPNGVVIVTTEEKVHFDDDVVGRLSLKMDLLVRGLIMASQGQMDAGYQGHVFALFYNLSDQMISITRAESILRLELIRLHSKSARPYNASGDYQNKGLGDILEGPVGSSLQDIRAEVENANNRLRELRLGAAVLAALGVVVPIVVLAIAGVFSSVSSLRERTSKLEGSNSVLLDKSNSVPANELCKHVAAIERKLHTTLKLNCP